MYLQMFALDGFQPAYTSVSVCSRLYSDYLYFKMANKSVEDFHQKVIESVQLFQSCLSERPLRSCVYNTSLSNAMPVIISEYSPLLQIYYVIPDCKSVLNGYCYSEMCLVLHSYRNEPSLLSSVVTVSQGFVFVGAVVL